MIVKENVEVKQTRPKRSEQMKPQLEKGDVGRYLRHALDGFNLPPIDISDIEQVKGRCEWYFNHCIEDDVRPTVTGLSNALGITRQTFNRNRQISRRIKRPPSQRISNEMAVSIFIMV